MLNFGNYVECFLYRLNRRQISIFLDFNGPGHAHFKSMYPCLKWFKPTGTSVEFKELNSVINMSLTACKIDHDMHDKDEHIQPLPYVGFKNRDEFIDEFVSEVGNSTTSSFYWLDDELTHICKTIDLHLSEEIKIINSYGLGWGTDAKNMKLYIHETMDYLG